MWTGEGGQAPCGRPHRKLKLEPIDVILSSHAKKLASFYQNFIFEQNNSCQLLAETRVVKQGKNAKSTKVSIYFFKFSILSCSNLDEYEIC